MSRRARKSGLEAVALLVFLLGGACATKIAGGQGGEGATSVASTTSGQTTSVASTGASGGSGSTEETVQSSTATGEAWPECIPRNPEATFSYAFDLAAWDPATTKPGYFVVDIDGPCVVASVGQGDGGIEIELGCEHPDSKRSVPIIASLALPGGLELMSVPSLPHTAPDTESGA